MAGYTPDFILELEGVKGICPAGEVRAQQNIAEKKILAVKKPACCALGSVPLSGRSKADDGILPLLGFRSRRTKAPVAAGAIRVGGIKKGMCVISAEGCRLGFVSGLEGKGMIRMTAINAAGCGYDHLVPLSWVGAIDRYVHLDKMRAYVAANSLH